MSKFNNEMMEAIAIREAMNILNLPNLEYETIKDKLAMKLYDGEFKDRIQDLVTMKLDNGFEMGFCIMPESGGDDEIPTVNITKTIAKLYRYDKMRMLVDAMANAEKNTKVIFSTFPDFIFSKSRISDPRKIKTSIEQLDTMYILTTDRGIFGAVALYYEKMPESIANLIGGDYYVLPSSIHEVIIVPKNRTTASLDELKSMVKSVNGTNAVSAKDFLSDRVLMYDSSKKRLVDATVAEKEKSAEITITEILGMELKIID